MCNNKNEQCLDCATGYFLDYFGLCTKCDDNCLECTAYSCSRCEEGFAPMGQSCNGHVSQRSHPACSSFSNCKKCSTTVGGCSECEAGFFVSSFTTCEGTHTWKLTRRVWL